MKKTNIFRYLNHEGFYFISCIYDWHPNDPIKHVQGLSWGKFTNVFVIGEYSWVNCLSDWNQDAHSHFNLMEISIWKGKKQINKN